MMVESTGDLAEAWKAILTKPTVNVEVACRALNLSLWSGYQAIKRGDFPTPTLRVGHRILVPTAPLRKALGIEQKSA